MSTFTQRGSEVSFQVINFCYSDYPWALLFVFASHLFNIPSRIFLALEVVFIVSCNYIRNKIFLKIQGDLSVFKFLVTSPTLLFSLPTIFLELYYKLCGIVKMWLVWARDVSNRKMALSSYSLGFSFLLIVFIRPFPAWRCSCVTQNGSSVVLLFLCHLLRSHHLFETVAKTLYSKDHFRKPFFFLRVLFLGVFFEKPYLNLSFSWQ